MGSTAEVEKAMGGSQVSINVALGGSEMFVQLTEREMARTSGKLQTPLLAIGRATCSSRAILLFGENANGVLTGCLRSHQAIACGMLEHLIQTWSHAARG